MSVSKEELQQIPHLNVAVLGDRVVNLMALWDGERWHSWVPVGNKVVKMQMVDVSQCLYLAKAAVRPANLFIPRCTSLVYGTAEGHAGERPAFNFTFSTGPCWKGVNAVAITPRPRTWPRTIAAHCPP